ncbi:hypothetical protein ACQ4PT_010372 [Festuca glaucescens]
MDETTVNRIFQQKLREFPPPGLMEGITAWNAAGQVGPIQVPSAGGSNSSFNVSPDLVTPPPTIVAAQPMNLDAPLPPHTETTKAQPAAAVVLHNAPEPEKNDRPAAAPVSTLPQLNALTKDTPCVLMHYVPGGELKDVATGMLIQPKSRTMHNKAMDDAAMRVELGRVLPGCEDMDPPIQPPGADDHLTLKGCHGWSMTWPKTQIRLGGRSTGATSIVRPRKAPTVLAATTSHHQKLLGASAPPQGKDVIAPQPPSAPPKGKAIASPPPSPPPPPQDVDMAANDDNIDMDDDAPVDVNAYLNTGADKDELYMPRVDEEPFHARDDQAGLARSTKQRLVFRGFSEETPPAADTQEPSVAFVFSPNTLQKTVDEQLAAAEDTAAKKKHRKRPNKNEDKAASQPAPRIHHQDDIVPARKDGLTRMHEAGKPILSPELIRLVSGPMLSLHEGILHLEELLLKEKDPNYPVFMVKVPRHVGFVTDAPADVFFIAYEDIFKLFHSRRLDYNLDRLFTLNLAMRIKRESTPYVTVADPYYMRDSQLVGSTTRARAKSYLQKFLLNNKRKDNILLPFFPE